MRRVTLTTAVFGTLMLLAAGCGDDGDDSAAAYCEMSRTMNATESMPGLAQLEELVEAAPSEIRDDVQTIVDAVESGELGDDVMEAEANITAYEIEHCGEDTAGGGGDESAEGGASEAPAIVTFTSPRDGDTVSNPVVVEPSVSNAEIAPADESGAGQGHYHVLVDQECLATGDQIPSDDDHIHFGDGSTSLELPELEPGEHSLCLQLGDSDHRAFGAASTITIEVEG